MCKGIFPFLGKHHLTTLKIRYDYRTDTLQYIAFREWEEDRDFSRYSLDFTAESFLSDYSIFLGRKALDKQMGSDGLASYFRDLADLIRENKYFGVDFYYHEKHDIRLMVFDHNRTKGDRNKAWGKTLGGIRRHMPEKSEWEVITDGIKLGPAMTYKAAALDLPAGGSKILVQMEQPDLTNVEIIGFLSYVTDKSHVITAPDMNLPIELSDEVKKLGYSRLFVGGKTAAVGRPGDATALGILLSMKTAVAFREGEAEFPLKDKKVLLMGYGSVGRPLLEYLLAEKAEVTLAVRNPEAVPRGIAVVPYEEAVFHETDILCPCAAGCVIREEEIHLFKCRYIWGAANNQLDADSREDEFRMARKLQEQGIFYEAEWWHNGGGILCMAEEYFYDGNKESVEEKLREMIPARTAEVLRESEKTGMTPTEICYSKCEEEIYRSAE